MSAKGLIVYVLVLGSLGWSAYLSALPAVLITH
jgi:hypothetical protein